MRAYVEREDTQPVSKLNPTDRGYSQGTTEEKARLELRLFPTQALGRVRQAGQRFAVKHPR